MLLGGRVFQCQAAVGMGHEVEWHLGAHTRSGAALDGDGNGTAGDNYVLVSSGATGVFRLFGDADGDGDVDNSDFTAFRTAFGTGPSIFDSDGDGDTDNADFTAFRSRFGTTLP